MAHVYNWNYLAVWVRHEIWRARGRGIKGLLRKWEGKMLRAMRDLRKVQVCNSYFQAMIKGSTASMMRTRPRNFVHSIP